MQLFCVLALILFTTDGVNSFFANQFWHPVTPTAKQHHTSQPTALPTTTIAKTTSEKPTTTTTRATSLAALTTKEQHACVCNTNHPQLVIFECPDRASNIIGFLYLQDTSFSLDLSSSHCQDIARSVISPDAWFPVIHDGKVGFIRNDAGVSIQMCPGPALTINGIQPKPCQKFVTPSPGVSHTSHKLTPITSPRPTTAKSVPTTAIKTSTLPTTTTSTTATKTSKLPTTTTSTTAMKTSTLPTTTTSTTTRTVTPTTKPSTTSNIYDHACNSLEVVLELGKHEPVYHAHARQCAGGDSKNEAVVMKYCYATEPSTWTQGRQVLNHCSDIPPYTPINMYGFGSNMIISGIFIRCTSATEFLIIHQKDCIEGLRLDTINMQSGSGMFYVIHW
uniref:Integumentary mucin C.1-like isoform X2 n=1 Tax=Crassostrea virginica TaxID=6565 RepID=A0A8B8EU10_CRAVI|nr:integumentary mucin C.1-like isoform X2 [Crassostrea virginica]